MAESSEPTLPTSAVTFKDNENQAIYEKIAKGLQEAKVRANRRWLGTNGACEIARVGFDIKLICTDQDELTWDIKWNAFGEAPADARFSPEFNALGQINQEYLEYLGLDEYDPTEPRFEWQMLNLPNQNIQYRFRESEMEAAPGVYLVRAIPKDARGKVKLRQRLVYAKDRQSLEKFLAQGKLS